VRLRARQGRGHLVDATRLGGQQREHHGTWRMSAHRCD
jgi:hypothetical protein